MCTQNNNCCNLSYGTVLYLFLKSCVKSSFREIIHYRNHFKSGFLEYKMSIWEGLDLTLLGFQAILDVHKNKWNFFEGAWSFNDYNYPSYSRFFSRTLTFTSRLYGSMRGTSDLSQNSSSNSFRSHCYQ